jgi:hypothetical protein
VTSLPKAQQLQMILAWQSNQHSILFQAQAATSMAYWPNIGLAPTRGNIELIRSDPFGNEKNDDLAFLHLLPILVLSDSDPRPSQNVVP